MNPMEILMNRIMNNPQIENNPIAKNALQMYRNGDTQGLKDMAENMCNERGIPLEKAKEEAMKLFN